MSSNNIEVNKLLKASEQFLVPLRMGDGFDEEKFLALCDALQDCTQAWAEIEHVPKLAVNVLVDLYPAAFSSSYLYSGEEGDKIREQIEKLEDLVRSSVTIPN